MDEATKSAAAAAARSGRKPGTAKRDPSTSFVAYMNQPAEQAAEGESSHREELTNSAEAPDQRFKERQKNQGAPRLLDVPNEGLVSNGGPIQLTGNIRLVLEEGTVQYANHLALCRCGSSNSKPICDGQHMEREFLHPGEIKQVSEVGASSRPGRITFSCIKDGPITFRGHLRLHNRFGQECVKMRGSLCRCGQSANKPFCDGSHERVGFKTNKG